jgi:hypothetical protein
LNIRMTSDQNRDISDIEHCSEFFKIPEHFKNYILFI